MKRSTSDSTTLIAIGALVAAHGIYWFIKSMRHSHAGLGSYAITALALAAGLALVGYGFYMRRRERDGAFTD